MPSRRASADKARKSSGSGIYVYDPEQDTRGKGDALGSEPKTGRRYLGRFEELHIETEAGDDIRITMVRDRNGFDGIEIRNNGRTMATGLAVVPHSSNVARVYPHDA